MLTISCITCNFCALNIINRKKAEGDVIGGYSNLLPLGILSVIFQLAVLRLTSRDHLFDRTIVFPSVWRQFPQKVRAQLISVQFASAREFRAGKSLSSEQCSSTFEFEESSRLLT